MQSPTGASLSGRAEGLDSCESPALSEKCWLLCFCCGSEEEVAVRKGKERL